MGRTVIQCFRQDLDFSIGFVTKIFNFTEVCSLYMQYLEYIQHMVSVFLTISSYCALLCAVVRYCALLCYYTPLWVLCAIMRYCVLLCAILFYFGKVWYHRRVPVEDITFRRFWALLKLPLDTFWSPLGTSWAPLGRHWGPGWKKTRKR